MTDGRIDTAAGDQSRGWCAPPMVEEADSGSWPPDPTAPAPCFRATSRQAAADDDTATDSDDEVTNLTSDVFSDPTGPTSDPPKRRTAAIRTAKDLIDYNMDWDGAEGAADPCLAALELLRTARQSVDTWRWWTMRWSQNAVRLVGRAGSLSPGKTQKLTRALRKHAPNYLGQLWMLTSDQRHEKEGHHFPDDRAQSRLVPCPEAAGEKP